MNDIIFDVAEIERFIGRQLRVLRVSKGYSLGDLAKKLNISYQQVQKYEGGGNRLSVGRLWQISDVLGVDPKFFFMGLASSTITTEVREATPDHIIVDPLLVESSEEMKLFIAFKAIKDREHKRLLIKMAQALESVA